MWNKRPEAPSLSLEPPVRLPSPKTEVPEATAAPGRPVAAVIGPSMNIRGEIRTREELFVDGEVEGVVESLSLVTVGPNGKIKANIKAREVVVFGSVRGNVEAAEKVAIRDNGRVIGDIKTCGISIDDGAYFKGSIDISRPEPKATARPLEQPEAAIPAAVL